MSRCSISHKGIVREISESMIIVAIAAESACGDCHAKTICGFSEISEKLVHVQKDCSKQLKPGDEVQVVMDSKLGTKAVLWAYIIPLFILIASIFICMQFTNELLAACIGVSLVACHYVLLYKNQDKLDKRFSFSIKTNGYDNNY